VGLFLLLELFPVQFGQFYNITEPQTQAMLSRYLRIFAIYLPFLAPVFVLRSFYQATKHTNEATVISMLEGTIVTIPVFLVLSALSTDLMWMGNCLGALISLAIVMIVMQKRGRREGADNFLMLQETDIGRSHEFSLDASLDGAENASRETISFLRGCGVSEKVANAMGVAAEELCVNVAHYAGVPPQEQIDAFLRVLDDRVLLKVRDSGIPFKPTEFIGETGERITGLALIRAMGCQIEYDRIIGFNTTIITALREHG
jgi:anti-sigma regulatory factor (Ser/Thr protein kinase)